MSRINPKQKKLAKYRRMACLAIALHLPFKSSLINMYTALAWSRYRKRPKAYGHLHDCDWQQTIDKIHATARKNFTNTTDFHQRFRLTPSEFTGLLELIKHHPIFHTGGPCKQAPPMYQLSVALYRLGHNGSGANMNGVSHTFGVSEGTATLWTKHVVVAIISLEKQAMRWPDLATRAALVKKFAEEGIPGGCVGVVDGVMIPFYQTPACTDAADFFSHKSRYGYSVLAVCDADKRIVYAQYNFPGSCHDAQVFNASGLIQNAAQHFTPGQYLLGDSAFPAGDYCVPIIKLQCNAQHLEPPGCLQGLCVRMKNETDEAIATGMIRACFILHNLYIATGDWYRQDNNHDPLTDAERWELEQDRAQWVQNRGAGNGAGEEEQGEVIELMGLGTHTQHRVMREMGLELTVRRQARGRQARR
ncbi:hypothetical protein I350_03364 [Cryptococcus amylolentus CBS 6273]|uniref:DDE Tnp4 domain-containing protein n=1 Tax=Cryptococcus amylolentus CBS 6273 TaxID=1296118 RepID=A0A1E3K3W5_9TREE|nr:hypothetical protein I350_03364 [Cryptococcus amylolentus CBS 6273]